MFRRTLRTRVDRHTPSVSSRANRRHGAALHRGSRHDAAGAFPDRPGDTCQYARSSSGNDMTSPSRQFASDCEREPIHIPDAIQAHGVLLVVDPSDLTVVEVAGDSSALLGMAPELLLGQSVRAQLGTFAVSRLDILLARYEQRSPHSRFLLQVDMNQHVLDVTAHISGGLIVLELERRAAPVEFDVMQAVQRMVESTRGEESVAMLLKCMTAEVQTVSGFDRVMLYRFDADGSGHVAAETRRSEQIESFLDLHYPADDIPAQARALYAKNWIRCIPDVHYTPQPLLRSGRTRIDRPLDLTFSTLRSVSPVHLEYLANMGVAASMSLSIVVRGQLWGLIACHHRQPHYLDSALRAGLELFAQLCSLQLETRLEIESARQDARRRELQDELLRGLSHEGFPQGLVSNAPLLASLVSATGVVVLAGGQTFRHGRLPGEETLEAILAWLNDQPALDIWSTDRLGVDIPGVSGNLPDAAGLLALSVSRRPRDYILWFVPELPSTVTWAGNPAKSIDAAGRLGPRKSFAAWVETVMGRSRPWAQGELDAALRLRMALLESALLDLSEVIRQQNAARDRQDLVTAELDHRVKNILATIQSLVRFSGKSATSLADFTRSLEERLVAMARSHDLLTVSRWSGASLHKVIAEELAAYCRNNANLVIEGEDLGLAPATAMSLSLILHELATNAVKYGCLSVAEGVLAIRTQATPGTDGAPSRVSLLWVERNGPMVVAPSHSGFGRVLLEKIFAKDSNTRVQLAFEPAGVVCRLDFDAPQRVAESPPESLQMTDAGMRDTEAPQLLGLRVLVVEDDPLLSADVAEILGASGVSVVGPYRTLDEALTAVAAAPFDTALLDVDLGGVSVWPVAKAIAARGLPIVFATGFADPKTRLGEFGESLTLRKPYTIDELLRTVHQSIQRAR
ncbi:MAG: HWE histidine kinase domain-containing protein [Rhodanobacteraceae bacterium]